MVAQTLGAIAVSHDGPKFPGPAGQMSLGLSAAALAQPKNTALAEQVQTMFRGETLRGLLLNAYGFWQMGQIMLIGAILAFAGAAVLLIMSLFGIAHLRRAAPESEVFPKLATRAEVNAA
jgi:hypothetical protein